MNSLPSQILNIAHSMEKLYKYIPSTDYIDSLTFDYVETYSFQRGTQFEENQKLITPEYENLKVRKEKSSNLTTTEEQRFSELHELLGFTQYLINDKGQFHPSSRKTNTFRFGDPEIETMKNILRTEINDVPRFLCAPLYRDAIVFRNKSNENISTLNICLSCQYMATKMFNHINADYETYDLFKRFFIDIGHEVEDPTHFISDNLKKLKEKYSKLKPT